LKQTLATMLSTLMMTTSRTAVARLVVANSKALSRAGAARNMATGDTFHKKASVRCSHTEDLLVPHDCPEMSFVMLYLDRDSF
jgi:hypothetical protein